MNKVEELEQIVNEDMYNALEDAYKAKNEDSNYLLKTKLKAIESLYANKYDNVNLKFSNDEFHEFYIKYDCSPTSYFVRQLNKHKNKLSKLYNVK